MTHPNRVITPATPTEITQTPDMGAIQNMKRPGGDRLNITVHQHHYHQAPAAQDRPSHYSPGHHTQSTDQQLAIVAKWGLGSLVALLCTLLLGQAIVAWGNANYWANERQHERIYNHPGHPVGGQW